MSEKSGDEDVLSYPKLVARSIEELRIKTAAHDGLWHLADADWSVDQGAGTIVFSRKRGVVATCPVQIIGTFNTADSTWLWAWDHPSVQPPLSEHASLVRDYGEVHGIERLTTRKLKSTQEECWEFAALACNLAAAQGAYRGPAGQTLIFMTFGEPQLSVVSASASLGTVEPLNVIAFVAEIPQDVQKVVTGFIAAHYEWETTMYTAAKACATTRREEVQKQGQAAYEALIHKWCGSNAEPLPISFSSNPMHDPDREFICHAAMSDETWVVRTRYTDSTGFASNYEYHLRSEGERWFIKNLLYVADHGKYECL